MLIVLDGIEFAAVQLFMAWPDLPVIDHLFHRI